MNRLFAILFALAAGTFCAVAMGQTVELRQAVVAVGMRDPSNPSGSFRTVGTVIDRTADSATVLTVAHLADGGRGQFWVAYPDGRRVDAQLVGLDRAHDLAVLRAPQPGSVAVMPIADVGEIPTTGDTVEFIGHGGGQLRHMLVKVRGYAMDTEAGDLSQLVADFQPISGDSGGPFVFKGKLVGVQWGGPAHAQSSGAYESHGTEALHVRQFLTQYRVCPPGGNCQPQYYPQQQPTQPPLVPVTPQQPKTVKGETGPAGPQGPPGAKGDPGPPGKDGKSPSREELVAIIREEVIAILADSQGSPDYDVIAAEVQSRLDPIYANPDDKTGTKLGGVLPPFTAQVKDGSQLLPGDKGTRQVYLGQKLPIKRSTTGTASPAK